MKNADFIERCWIEKIMDGWDRGFDTATMAEKFHRPESFVATCVRIGREKRLQSKEAAE